MALAVAAYSLSVRASQDVPSNRGESLPSCADQHRSLPGIVFTCLTTIFLCIWSSVHINVPEPVDTRGLNSFKRLKIWIKLFVRRNVVPVIIALVFPEWVLGMAVLQFTRATQLAKKIGMMRDLVLLSINDRFSLGATRRQGFFILMGGFHLFGGGQVQSVNKARTNIGYSNHPLELVGESHHAPPEKKRNGIEEEFGKPLHPLDEFDVCHCIDTGKLLLPTSAELDDKCKRDGLARFVVVLQTLWFLAQCALRKFRKLSITELEIITLGYILLTMLMNVAWWDKPYWVKFPVRVYETLPERTNEQKVLKKKMEKVNPFGLPIAYAIGIQGEYVDLRGMKRVPMFHSGYVGAGNYFSKSVGAQATIIGGMLFAAVHFLAWSSSVPPDRTQYLWRLGTILMIIVPPATVIALCYAALIDPCIGLLVGTLLIISLPLCYWIGRGMTILVTVKTLKSLPIGTYRGLEWFAFFPHI
ncbi:hypothetical protein PIIN_07577 [Serendipita indica DSM 11827]|uniref:Uncharacterized protein n=1 Tax=Serendipita indica (strain DSM 11827) TaxID=1109443 RepID=G4TQN1_SERID|nr:hypothetical protein PIIN_07577 [Serendipita indica DSM 11827]